MHVKINFGWNFSAHLQLLNQQRQEFSLQPKKRPKLLRDDLFVCNGFLFWVDLKSRVVGVLDTIVLATCSLP